MARKVLSALFSSSGCLRLIAAGMLVLGLAGSGVWATELRIDTIGVSPFGFIGTDGKPTGMMYEIGNMIAEEAGFTPSNRIVPYARTVVDLDHGDVDFVLRYGNDELTKVAIQVSQVLSFPTIVVGRASIPLRALGDLRGRTVGILRGGHFDDRLEADVAIHKYAVADYEQMLKMLFANRLDAGVGSTAGIYYSAQKLGLSPGDLGEPLVLNEQQFELHFSKQSAQEKTIVALKTAVERLKKRGEFTNVVNKYLGNFKWDVIPK